MYTKNANIIKTDLHDLIRCGDLIAWWRQEGQHFENHWKTKYQKRDSTQIQNRFFPLRKSIFRTP